MNRMVNDFIADWSVAEEGTIRVLQSLSHEKLYQAIIEGHNTLDWLGCHIATIPSRTCCACCNGTNKRREARLSNYKNKVG